MMKLSAILALSAVPSAVAKPNPIRRVVTLLQEMSKEISDETEKEKKMYEKFKCYCKKNTGEFDAKTKEAAALIKRTKAEVEGLSGQKKQLKEELKKHKQERQQAEADLKAASSKRGEEKAKYDEATKEHKKTLESLTKAIAALDKGMGKAFLQTGASRYLKAVVDSTAIQGLDITEQETLNNFLQTGGDYSSQSGEIVGILKMIKENIDNELGGVVQQEDAAVKAFTVMQASLQTLIKTSGKSIEKKQEIAGEVAVKVVEGKNLVSVTEKQLGDDLATAVELKQNCKDKDGEFATRQKDGAAEVDAINQAIEVLNNDDALDLFKKTDTKKDVEGFAQLSLLQMAKSQSPLFSALDKLAKSQNNPTISMMVMTTKNMLKAGKVDFSKVLKMIDDMVALLKQESEDDLKARDDCNVQLNDNEADLKEIGHAIKGLNAQIEDAASTITAQVSALDKNQKEISAAQKAMAEATEQRKAENADFVELVALNKDAVELIMKAKDKLNAFYNPDLIREVPAEEAAKESFVQAPEGAPETWEAGERKTQGQKSGNILSLMDMLATDLNNDTKDKEHAEQTAQSDYEKLSVALKQQVADCGKALAQAQSTKADTESEKQTLESTLEMKTEEETDTKQTIADLHARCDFIVNAFEERKAARENEIAGLQKAMAVLKGAKLD